MRWTLGLHVPSSAQPRSLRPGFTHPAQHHRARGVGLLLLRLDQRDDIDDGDSGACTT